MATAESTLHVVPPSRSAAVLDVLQMVSGAALILFMWSHMLLVSSVLISPDLMNDIAHFLEATYAAQIGGPLIGVAFLFHAVLAARKIPFRGKEYRTAVTHAKMLRHSDTWMWLVQVVSAMAILIMGAIHMWVVLTTLPISAAKSAGRVQAGWVWFYALLLPLIELHVGIGFFRIAVKWGWIKRRGRKAFGVFEKLLTLFFITVGTITLIRFATFG